MYNLIIRPLLFCIDPEKVHRMLLSWLKFYRYLFPVRACVRGYSRVSDPFSYGHLQFKNRIGLSAGFDKNAEAFDELADFGFGFLEVGTVTPDSQSGNPSPRIFRLVDDESLISRTGFNNCGVDAVRQHIRKYRKHSYVLGVNINKNPLSTGDQIVKDFESTFIHLYDCVDYFTLNWGSIDNDLLDINPKDRLTTKDYFTNEEQLQLYSNQFYSNNFPGDGDIYRDDADMLIVSPLSDEVSGQRVIPETGGGWSWSALRSINFLLDNLGNCKDQKVRDKYEALARFFRAYFYFEKVKRFGDVPWYDKVLGSDDADLYKARDSREFVMGKIMEDLNFAIEVFKETNRTKELYRVTWWTAQALKSRVGLFEGTYRKYHGLGDYEKYLNDCVSASNEIMTASGGYSLYQSGSQSYRNLFKSENAIDAEIILARDYNNDLSLVHKVQAFENSPTLGRPGLSKKLVNYYLMKNGNRFTDQPNYATMEFKDEIVNRDPRLAQTIRTSNINMNVTMTGYHLLKYANDNMSYTGDSSNDLPLFRLAEVYLNYAEAKAELGTLTQTDIDNTINKLRTRAGVTGKLNMNAANLSPDPYMCAPETGYVNVTGDNKGVILEIRRERAIELVMEGFRYYDLMRWKEGQCMAQSFKGFYLPATAINKAYDIDGDGTNDVCFYTTSSQPNVGSVTYVKLASDGSGTSLSEGNYGNLLCYSWIDRTWNENRDYLYPVPRQEITLSDGVVTQNPGWNE